VPGRPVGHSLDAVTALRDFVQKSQTGSEYRPVRRDSGLFPMSGVKLHIWCSRAEVVGPLLLV
jgi:hypothetical protein